MGHEPRTCSYWDRNGTDLRGIGSKSVCPGDGPRTEEEAKEGVKVWENGWIAGLPEVYADYCSGVEGPDAVYTILVFGASMAGPVMKNSVVHLVPSLTGAVEVDDEETHVSLEGADLVALA